MKSIDKIIVTVDVLLSLDIAGLPTTDYAMRRHDRNNNWPHAFNDNGKYLYFIEAIPPPFGDTIRLYFSRVEAGAEHRCRRFSERNRGGNHSIAVCNGVIGLFY